MNVKSRTDEELGDMIYYLSQYDFEIKYSPGKLNLEADCLSRNPVLDENDNMDEQLKIVNLINLKDVLKDQEKNIEIQNKKNTVGGFGGSRSKKNYLHILIDHFTRYAYILTSKTQNAKDFIKLIKSVKEVDEII
ncbi:hypothetical protein PV325_007992 [Microctonus aethiopoides]|nr:hypothetical protein PV325_007992 [Microctonus aethiopoides]